MRKRCTRTLSLLAAIVFIGLSSSTVATAPRCAEPRQETSARAAAEVMGSAC